MSALLAPALPSLLLCSSTFPHGALGDGEGPRRIMQCQIRGVSCPGGLRQPKTQEGSTHPASAQHKSRSLAPEPALDTISVKSNQTRQKSTYTMILRILIQGLFHGIWTGFTPQSRLAFPREVLHVLSCTWDRPWVWESPCQHQEGIQPWNDLLKRNQLMGNHAMTSTSGSSNIFPLQMQSDP